MTKEVNTHIIFNENCEYKSSTTDIIINVEPQPVNIDIDIKNLNTAHTNKGDYNNYYDDIIEIEAHVYQQIDNNIRDIQTGRVSFYYRPITSNKTVLLNDDSSSCILTNNGKASLQFRPNQSGTIIAKYIDDNEWYDTAEKSDEILLKPIPVIINFTKKPPYLTDLENSVELEVEVRKKYPNNNTDTINYGVVTFLHYIEHADMNQPDKRVEYVIGNPALVSEGKATIKYIPVQEYDDLEPTTLVDGTEYIRAVYSYNNDLYFSEENAVYGYETIEPNRTIGKWEYFTSANVYTNIAIFKPNSVLIGISNKSIDDDGRYYFEENTPIQITATLFDANGDEIILPQDSQKTLTFHIIGTYPTLTENFLMDGNEPVENSFIYNKYEKDLSFDDYIDGHFSKTISNLKPGNYTIQASTHGQIINGTVLLYDSDEVLNITEVNIDGEEHIKYDTNEVRNDIYLDSIDISNTLYINSTFKEISYNIVMRNQDTTIKTQQPINNYIESEVIIDNKYKQLLHNQKCKFFSPKTGETYIGNLQSINGKLIGRPISDIKFNSGDYPLYMYIPGGYYTNGTTNIRIKYQPSNTIILNVRNDIVLNLDYNFISDTTLGSINYTVSSDDIYEDENVNVSVTLKKNNSIITTHSYILTSDTNRWTNIIDNLAAGDYTLTASAINSVSKNFTIQPGIFEQEIQTDSKIIRATPNGVVNLVISSLSVDLTDLNLNKLHVYACKNTDTFNMNDATLCQYNIKYITQDTAYLVVNAGTYLPTKLLIAAYYEGDNNIREVLCEADECNTTLIEPIIKPQNYTNTTALFTIEPVIMGTIVIGTVQYYNNDTLIEERLFITSETLEIFLQNIPTNCNNIKFIINPYDNNIIQHIVNNTIPSNIEHSTTSWTGTNLTLESKINKVKTQYQESSNQCLFPLLKQKSIKFSRNIR